MLFYNVCNTLLHCIRYSFTMFMALFYNVYNTLLQSILYTFYNVYDMSYIASCIILLCHVLQASNLSV